MSPAKKLAMFRMQYMLEKLTACHLSFLWPTQAAVDCNNISIKTIERQLDLPNEPTVYFTSRIVMITHQFFYCNFERFRADYGFNFFRSTEVPEDSLAVFFSSFCQEITRDNGGYASAINPAMGGYGYSRVQWDLIAATGSALFILTQGGVAENDWSKLPYI